MGVGEWVGSGFVGYTVCMVGGLAMPMSLRLQGHPCFPLYRNLLFYRGCTYLFIYRSVYLDPRAARSWADRPTHTHTHGHTRTSEFLVGFPGVGRDPPAQRQTLVWASQVEPAPAWDRNSLPLAHTQSSNTFCRAPEGA